MQNSGEGCRVVPMNERKVVRFKCSKEVVEDAATVPSRSYLSTLVDPYHYIQRKGSYYFIVNHVVTPGLFFMEFATHRSYEFQKKVYGKAGDLRPKFWNDLQHFYNEEDMRKLYGIGAEILQERLYVYKDGDDWERVRALETNIHKVQRKVLVLFVDTGASKWVVWEQLYEIASIFTEPSARGFLCKLSEICEDGKDAMGTPRWSNAACEKFKEMVLGEAVSATVISKHVGYFTGTKISQCNLSVDLYLVPKVGSKFKRKCNSVSSQLLSQGLGKEP